MCRKILCRLLAAAVTALLLAGCGGGEQETSDQTVLRRGNGNDPQTLDPALADDVHAFAVLGDLYEGLLTVDAAGKPVPGVAESWQVSEDGRVYTFRLRADARWSDGEPVVARQFAEGFRRALAPATGSGYGFLLAPIRNAAAVTRGEQPPSSLGVSAPDDRTLVIELESSAGYFLSILSMPIAFPLRDADAADDATRYSDPARFIGNGPYLLGEWRPGGKLTLHRNPAFHASAEVAVDVIEYLPVSDPFSEFNMYRAGEIDLTATVPASMTAQLLDDHAADLHIAPKLALYYVAFDLSEAPLDDATLREALSMAIDREALVAIIGRGERPAYGLVPDGIPGYRPSRLEWESLGKEAREQEARRLYTDAGYGPDAPLQMTFMYDAGDIHETVAVALRSMWADVLGAQVRLDKREWQYFRASWENRADWQAMRFAWTGDYNHPATFTDVFRSNSPQNLAGYANTDYDHLLQRAATATDADEQMRLQAAAEARLLADNAIAPLYFYVSKHLVSPRVRGFEANAMDLHPSRYLRIIEAGTAR